MYSIMGTHGLIILCQYSITIQLPLIAPLQFNGKADTHHPTRKIHTYVKFVFGLTYPVDLPPPLSILTSLLALDTKLLEDCSRICDRWAPSIAANDASKML